MTSSADAADEGGGGGGGGDRVLAALASHAMTLVPHGARVGLGTGRAASAFIAALGARVRQGLVVTGVPTSAASTAQARAAGIPLGSLELEEGRQLDLTVDGADEVAPNLDVIKGRGGAMVRERIVAASSRRQVILVAHDKLVRVLGQRGVVPIEVIPMAEHLVVLRLKMLGLASVVRAAEVAQAGGGRPGAFVTENGNLILDCALRTPLADEEAARQLEIALRAIPGVVDTGLFLGTVERVLVGYPDEHVDVLMRPAAKGAV